ncbi:MAG: hypothetical protein KF916_04035 [Microbacteriaceae bacterium]|nr:hypothetical protein [Microbacteriaceae bacterium]
MSDTGLVTGILTNNDGCLTLIAEDWHSDNSEEYVVQLIHHLYEATGSESFKYRDSEFGIGDRAKLTGSSHSIVDSDLPDSCVALNIPIWHTGNIEKLEN